MSARAKLRSGPIRRGRAAPSAEVAQLQDEYVKGSATLRDAILELDDRTRLVSFAAAYDAGSSSAELYVPWGGTTPGTFGSPSALHALLAPFSDAKVVRISVLSSANPGQLRVRVYDLAGPSLYESDLVPAGANEVFTVEPDLTWPNGPVLVSVSGVNAIDEVSVTVTVEEVE